MAKLILNIIVIILISAYVKAGDDKQPHLKSYLGVRVYAPESECSMVGGLCVHTEDCAKLTSTRGLCPKNQARGIECCYEIPPRRAPCREHLGECMDNCPKRLQQAATDCGNKVCCVLVT